MFEKITLDTFEDLTNGIRTRIIGIKMKIQKRADLDHKCLQSEKRMKFEKLRIIKRSKNNDFHIQNNRRRLPDKRNSDDHYVFMDFTKNSTLKRKVFNKYFSKLE